MQSLTRRDNHSVLRDMNDTVRRMRLCGLLLLAGCHSDPSFAVSVHHASGYTVVQTMVTQYVGDDVNCSVIQFGDLTEAELSAIAIDEVDVTDGGEVEVSRLGGKSLVARGYDADHRFVTAGCKDVGEIAGAMKVDITTAPTAVVAIDPSQPDRPFSERTILVNMTDPNGTPIVGNVSWQLTGPAGAPEQLPAPGVATSRTGDARIHVDDLGIPGPEALRVRVPWATAPLPLVTAFDLSRASTVQLGGGVLASHPSCDLRGHAGKPPTLVCLTQANALQHRDLIEVAWVIDHYAAVDTTPLPGNNQFAVIVDRDDSADEPVYILSAAADGTGNWYKLGSAGSGKALAFPGPVQNAVYVPRCHDNSANALVGIQSGTALASQEQLYTLAGNAVGTAPNDGELFSAGCIADVDKVEHQAVVVTGTSGDPVLVLIAGASQMQITGARLTGSGFVAVETQGMVEKRFAGARLQATGTVVFTAVLAPDNGGFKLVERTEVEAAAPPSKILGGKLDQDDDTDLVWDMTAARRHVFQVSLAKHVSGVPLTAITSGSVAISSAVAAASDFLVGDLNGHRTDELILFTQGAVTIYSPD
jgi:hypothetical protein